MNKARTSWSRFLGIFLLLSIAVARVQAQAFAPPPNLQKYRFWPQAGNFWDDLFPTNHVDLDPGPGVLDFHCTSYTYDGHRGIDTSIVTFGYMDLGVPIFAALDGTVLNAHDGEDDRSTTFTEKPMNYVALDHGGGHVTIYFHMKKGSVAVSIGQQVKAGQQIGLTGSSGYSAGPHLHFQSEYNGAVFEPFAGGCRPGPSNWASQPAFHSEILLRTFVITPDDLTLWKFPNDTSRLGTFPMGVQPVHYWSYLHNVPGHRIVTVRYLRPDGSVQPVADVGPSNSGPFAPSAVFRGNANVNLDVAGEWHLEFSINDVVYARAPFLVVNPGETVTNRPPAPITIAFDPPAATPDDVLFCRITSSPILDDPDYDIVRYRYVWRVNGAIIRDVTSAGRADAIPHSVASAGDTVSCSVTPSDGKTDGTALALSTVLSATQLSPLLNLSTRADMRPGDEVLIGGFIVRGPGPKRLVLRALGPSLNINGQPIVGRLADPSLELYAAGEKIAQNNDWADTQRDEVIASGLQPQDARDSAIVASLEPGAYTAIVRGVNGATGLALVEIYDSLTRQPAKAANVSSRGVVGGGDQVMIAGFIVGNEGSTRDLVVRAVGPSLVAAGLSNALTDPVLTLYDSQGTALAANDDWQDDPAQAQRISDADLALGDTRESAIARTFTAGAYTAILSGKNGLTGIALVEVYDAQGSVP